ncbi:hypothetical protein EYF80_067829 [Liparis tanakae]|uniref:Uncharacterized protein n=1 Tax=Liparis tanakae TaxID=230148 RepID=A0A4Z2E004_9TELE|nr:hypothetical protein EYF80_067829 [Liparis tanakae]
MSPTAKRILVVAESSAFIQGTPPDMGCCGAKGRLSIAACIGWGQDCSGMDLGAVLGVKAGGLGWGVCTGGGGQCYTNGGRVKGGVLSVVLICGWVVG